MKSPPELFGRRLFLEPGEERFERQAVLNPTLLHAEDGYHMLYRAVDPEMVSTVGYLKLSYEEDGVRIVERDPAPLLAPREKFECLGAEDPRAVVFEDQVHLFYTGWDGYNARLCYTSGPDIRSFGSRRLIGPNFTNADAIGMIEDNPKLKLYTERWAEDPPDQALWEKDATILPRRVDGKIVMIHRLRPDIQVAYLDDLGQLDDLAFWEEYIRHMDRFRLMQQEAWWEDSHMGMGPVPIETEAGWLMIYHGVTRRPVLTYRAGAALLDRNDLQRVIGRTPEPLFEPSEVWETRGDVNNVVFPEGLVVHDGVLDIYYGGADKVIGVVSVRLDELLDFLT